MLARLCLKPNRKEKRVMLARLCSRDDAPHRGKIARANGCAAAGQSLTILFAYATLVSRQIDKG
jgi:hypothetical protein